MKKLQNQISEKLTLLGMKEAPSKSKKYRVFEHPEQAGHFYFVGTAGALRSGRTASDSFSIGSGQKALEKLDRIFKKRIAAAQV